MVSTMSEFLTEKEVGAILRRSGPTFRRWRATGRGPSWIKIGGRVLYPARDLAAWLKAQPAGGDASLCVLAPSAGRDLST
jgi:predicted DNA-binding transcriptional regulator AlpA